jgi:hypothetical protein
VNRWNGFKLSRRSSGSSIFQLNIWPSIRSSLKSMMEKPFFSRGFSPASTSLPVGVWGGVPRHADGQALGPVLIGPVRTETTGFRRRSRLP